MKKIGIAGFGRAGHSAAETLRKGGFDGQITVFTDYVTGVENPMLTTYYGSEKIEEKDVMPFGDLETLKEELGLDLKAGTKVEKIIPESCEILYSDGAGEKKTEKFDDIIIATGSAPILPPFEAKDPVKIITIRNIGDARRMNYALHHASKVLVVGCSMIGIKVVQGLSEHDADVTFIDFADKVFPTAVLLGTEEILAKRITDKGIKLKLSTGINGIKEVPAGDCGNKADGTQVSALDGNRIREVPAGDCDNKADGTNSSASDGNEKVINNNTCLEAEFSDGTKELFDTVFLCMGTRARIDIVKDTAVQTGRAIVVDTQMRTNIPHIYAAGDCCEAFEISTGQSMNVALWANAAEQGRIAAENILGKESAYDGNLICNITHFWDTDFVSIGNNKAEGELITWSGNKDYTGGKWYFSALIGEGRIQCVNIIDNPELSGAFKNIMKNMFEDKENCKPFSEYSFGRFFLPRKISEQITKYL